MKIFLHKRDRGEDFDANDETVELSVVPTQGQYIALPGSADWYLVTMVVLGANNEPDAPDADVYAVRESRSNARDRDLRRAKAWLSGAV